MANIQEVLVPDIGGGDDVDVIEVLVKPGDTVAADDSLITLESEKASMEIPSPFDGVVESLAVSVGDKISEGALILKLSVSGDGAIKAEKTAQSASAPAPTEKSAPTPAAEQPKATAAKPSAPQEYQAYGDEVHASPSVRRIAREFGIPLDQVQGTGGNGRIVKSDLQQFSKDAFGKPRGGGLNISDAPKIDFAKFGEIETKPLNKIKKYTAKNLTRAWLTIPHVTQFGDADITEMEEFRQEKKPEAQQRGVKLTPLVFIMKALVASLREFPQFNSSLDETGENLIIKNYYHIGVAADTPNGLVVPVIRDVDQKGMYDLAEELATISKKAREVGLTPAEMSGSTFTISSLGGIGGTAFTPIVKAPDVAILGVSRSSTKPVYLDGELVPRLMLPLSLSYDHRVIDGADGARFIVDLSNRLADIKTILL